VAVILTMALVAGCLGGGEGYLIQRGSSTVLPLAIAWAEEFDGAQISVAGGGSTHGFNSLLNEEADMADASRLLKGKDYQSVGGDPDWVNEDGTASRPVNGVLPTKWVVAFDVVVIVINNGNDWAGELNYSQLYTIFTDDDPVTYWDQVPGLDGAPHLKVDIYAPDEASGTYDFFFEQIIPRWGKEDQAAGTRLQAGDGVYHPSSDDNVILRAVQDNRNAIGYFGYAYYVENLESIKAVALAEGDGSHVPPSPEHVVDYPMTRELYIYSDDVPEAGGTINDYLRYVLGEEGQSIVPDVGYVRIDLVDPGIIDKQLQLLGAG
jgi:phosphate transport system substrate-binding protein